MTRRRIAIAGSSGSIGTQTIDVVQAEPDNYVVTALAVGSSADVVIEQAKTLQPEVVVVTDTAHTAAVAAALLIADGRWDVRKMVNVEELDPESFIEILDATGLPTDYLELLPGSSASFDGEVGLLEDEIRHATATVTVSAVDPMISLR